jgi:ribosomal protein L14
MIQLRSILEVADNTGARRAAMISKKGQNTDTAGVGDVITVHIKDSGTDATVKKGEVAKAVVVRTKAPVRRADPTSASIPTPSSSSAPTAIPRAPVSSALSLASCVRRTS